MDVNQLGFRRTGVTLRKWEVYCWLETEPYQDGYMAFDTKAEAVASRVKALEDWRKSKSTRTATKHYVPGKWPWGEEDGFDLRENGQVVGYVNLYLSSDR